MTWGVRYQVPSKIVDEKTDESLLSTHLQIEQFDPPKPCK